jgi:hypothetical protein
MKTEILKRLNCSSESEAIEKLESLILRIKEEIKEVQTNPNFINVRIMKVNTLAQREDQAQNFLNILKQ